MKKIYKLMLRKMMKKYGYENTLIAVEQMKSINDDEKKSFIDYIKLLKGSE